MEKCSPIRPKADIRDLNEKLHHSLECDIWKIQHFYTVLDGLESSVIGWRLLIIIPFLLFHFMPSCVTIL